MHYLPPSDAGRAGGDRSRIPPIDLFYLLATLLDWVLPQTKPALHRHQSQTAPVNKGASHNLLFTFLFSCCGWGWRSGGEEPAVMLVQHLGLNWGYLLEALSMDQRYGHPLGAFKNACFQAPPGTYRFRVCI